MDITLDEAAILALFLETLLYGMPDIAFHEPTTLSSNTACTGIYLVLFCLTFLVLLLRGESGKTQRHRLVPLSILMMIFATTVRFCWILALIAVSLIVSISH